MLPTTLATLLTYRQALALQRPVDAVTQGTFYCWVDVLLAEVVSSVLYNPDSTSGTQPTCPALARRLLDERISLASCLPCESYSPIFLSLFNWCCPFSESGISFSHTRPPSLIAGSSTFRYRYTTPPAMPSPRTCFL